MEDSKCPLYFSYAEYAVFALVEFFICGFKNKCNQYLHTCLKNKVAGGLLF